MLDPSPDECRESCWADLRKMFQQGRFWRLEGHRWPDAKTANSTIGEWASHIDQVLVGFQLHGPYSILSHQLLTFYRNLQKSAAACTSTPLYSTGHAWHICHVSHVSSEEWKNAYNLIASAEVSCRYSKCTLVHVGPSICSCLGQLKLSWHTL